MKTVFFLLVCGVLVVLNALDYATALPFLAWMPLVNAGLGVLLAVLGICGMRNAECRVRSNEGMRNAETGVQTDAPVLPSAVSRDERAKHELTAFLGMLQEKGRLVDFVMEDLNAQPDARVGQVARVVHKGCREVILKAFAPEPAEGSVAEGEALSLVEGFSPERYRLIGSGSGGAPKGKLVHRGWVAGKVALPEFSKDPVESGAGYVIAPAEIEVG